MEGSSAVGLDELIADVLAGRRRSIARAMSLAESTGPIGRSLAAGLYGHTGRAHVIGLTGVPGSGKSTMVRVLATALLLLDLAGAQSDFDLQQPLGAHDDISGACPDYTHYSSYPQ